MEETGLKLSEDMYQKMVVQFANGEKIEVEIDATVEENTTGSVPRLVSIAFGPAYRKALGEKA